MRSNKAVHVANCRICLGFSALVFDVLICTSSQYTSPLVSRRLIIPVQPPSSHLSVALHAHSYLLVIFHTERTIHLIRNIKRLHRSPPIPRTRPHFRSVCNEGFNDCLLHLDRFYLDDEGFLFAFQMAYRWDVGCLVINLPFTSPCDDMTIQGPGVMIVTLIAKR